MMVAVAAAAVVLVAATRLTWLHSNPAPDLLLTSRLHSFDTGSFRSPDDPAVRPIEARCDYECEVRPGVPSGLPFRVTVGTTLMTPASTPIESHRETHFLISGLGGTRGESSCRLKLRQPGPHVVQYEIVVTDLFGRERVAASEARQVEWADFRDPTPEVMVKRP
jgi:hypothetical protein